MHIVMPPPQTLVLGHGGPVSAGATLSEYILATVKVPARAMGPHGMLRIRSLWGSNNNGNSKTYRIRIASDPLVAAGTLICNFAQTTNQSHNDLHHFANQGSEAVQQFLAASSSNGGLGASSGALASGTVDTTADCWVMFTGLKGTDTADTITLAHYMVELLRP